MRRAVRYRHGPELMDKISAEIADLCAKHSRVLVRLHLLGDFWAAGYVHFWRVMLAAHPGLHVFGFTAWEEETEIGAEIARLRDDYPRRWWVRESGRTWRWGSFTLPFWTEEKTVGDAIVCPEQIDAPKGSPQRRHCGNCGACWSTDRPIAFMRHGGG